MALKHKWRKLWEFLDRNLFHFKRRHIEFWPQESGSEVDHKILGGGWKRRVMDSVGQNKDQRVPREGLHCTANNMVAIASDIGVNLKEFMAMRLGNRLFGILIPNFKVKALGDL